MAYLALLALFVLHSSTKVSAQTADARFIHEIALANSAEGRVQRLKHLKSALQTDPEEDDQIVVIYRIGVSLAQHGDPTDQSPPDRDLAVPWFQRIVDNFQHMDFYEPQPSNGTWDAQFIVPRAKVQLAGLQLDRPASEVQRRQLLLSAMDDMLATSERRYHDWISAPKPEALAYLDSMGKLDRRLEAWEERREAAQRGETLHSTELVVVEAAVRQFGYTYVRQAPWEVERGMHQLLERYRGTPIGDVATEHICRAAKITNSVVDQELEKTIHELKK